MSTKRFLEISQSVTIPVPLWLLLIGVTGLFTLAYQINEWKTALRDVSKAASEAWTVPMERESWFTFQEENRMRYPELKTPNAVKIFRDN